MRYTDVDAQCSQMPTPSLTHTNAQEYDTPTSDANEATTLKGQGHKNSEMLLEAYMKWSARAITVSKWLPVYIHYTSCILNSRILLRNACQLASVQSSLLR